MKKNAAYSVLILISCVFAHILIPNNFISTKVVIVVILAILATLNVYFMYKQKMISSKRILVAIPFIIFTILYAVYRFYNM